MRTNNFTQSGELFSNSNMIPIPNGLLIYEKHFFSLSESEHYFEQLTKKINWTNRYLKIYGKQVPMPRLLAWYADSRIEYQYSGGISPHNGWTEELLEIKSKIEQHTSTMFNGVLLNLYRNGQDSMSWHSDDEKTLGNEPIIASISFGETRKFQLKHKYNKQLPTLNIDLENGSLLLMQNKTQQYWQHRIPKQASINKPRINLTFRYIHQNHS